VTRFEVVRDPLWDKHPARSEAPRRRRHPRSSGALRAPAGHAFLVYRTPHIAVFEHALGAYHLRAAALSQLEDAGGRQARRAAEASA